MMKRIFLLPALMVVMILILSRSCKTTQPVQQSAEMLTTNSSGTGPAIWVEFRKGKAFNHPLMALWVEDMDGNYIQTLYVAESIAMGIFDHGDPSNGNWQPGPIRRPAALPYWSHKRNVQEEDGLYIPTPETPMPDAYTGATPGGDFNIETHLDEKISSRFKLLFEINQPWDWNEYWTNNKYPEDDEYKTSCQPALVYATDIDLDKGNMVYDLKVIGHSHYSGKTGDLYTDLSTITTALNITASLKAKVELAGE